MLDVRPLASMQMTALHHIRPLALTVLLLASNQCSRQEPVQTQSAPEPEVLQYATAWEPDPASTLFKFTRELPPIDQVRIYSQRFDDRKRRIVDDRRVILRKVEADRFIAVWRELKAGTSMGCFSPGYAIEFLSGTAVTLRADVCFHCHNVWLSPSDEITGFDPDGEQGVALKAALDAALSR